MRYPEPVVVYSACLAGDRVRYDDKPVSDPFAEKLLGYVRVVKVCPEVEIGLGVPREKVVLYKERERLKMSQPATGLELTSRMNTFAEGFLKELKVVDGFLLKSKSPSCGVSRTKTYSDPRGGRFRGFGKGLFALKVMESFPFLPVEDELTLRKERRRLIFLAALFGSALLREEGIRFHQRLEETLRVFTPVLERKMRESGSEDEYRKLMLKALRRLPVGVLGGFEFVPPELKGA